MANSVELIMPKMGESIAEATILKWLKNVGDSVEVDEPILEIATDKVDSEVPSPAAGIISEILFAEGDVVEVGKVLAKIGGEVGASAPASTPAPAPAQEVNNTNGSAVVNNNVPYIPTVDETQTISSADGSRFYSPLVMNIAKTEGISMVELESIPGTAKEGRVSKKDILSYVENRKNGAPAQVAQAPVQPKPAAPAPAPQPVKEHKVNVPVYPGDEIIEMDRMRKLIADHMVMSKHTAPHVTSFVEADVTHMVKWREKIKKDFEKREGEKITFTPLFIEAIVKAIKDFPMINISIDGQNIIKRKAINIGMAAALPSGNLIVPVIKNADSKNLIGLVRDVNDLANRARANKLTPDEISGGTFTLTNVGGFGNVMGTPIINQPQVAILAVGSITKKPVVMETEAGDVIAIRHMMFLSLSYDHRVVDGSLGGSFLRKVADYLEAFDPNRTY